MSPVVPLILLVAPLVLIVSFMNRNRSTKPSSPTNILVPLLVLGLLLAVPLVLATVYFTRMSDSTPGRSVSLSIDELVRNNNSGRPRQRSNAASSSTDVTVHSDVEFSSTAVWANLEEQPFDANVYPSQTAAVQPVVRKIHAAIDAQGLFAASGSEITQPAVDIEGPADESPVTEDAVNEAQATEVSAAELPLAGLTTPKFLLVHGRSPEKKTLARFAEQLRAEFPLSEIRVSPQDLIAPLTAATVPADTVSLVLRAVDETVVPGEPEQPSQQIHGQLLCDIVTSKGTATVSADYLRKPWVEDIGRFVSVRPQQQFVVGYSGQLVSSAEEAGRLALQDAQHKSRIAVDSGVFVTADASHIVDRFTQKLSRPYGDVWRTAVLLDVSRSRMQPIIMTAEHKARVQHVEHFSLVAAMAVLFGVTVVLCVGFNVLTQGYYRNRLWTGVAVVIGLGLLATLVRFVRMA